MTADIRPTNFGCWILSCRGGYPVSARDVGDDDGLDSLVLH